jgi:hypothetical protein
MVRLSKVLAAILSLLMAGPVSPSSAAAQTVPDSLVTQAEIDDALQRASAKEEASRDMIRELLAREEVRRLAKNAGIDVAYVEKAEGLVDTLEGRDLERAAGYAGELGDRLYGGDTVISIGLVTLLLIIITIILLAK